MYVAPYKGLQGAVHIQQPLQDSTGQTPSLSNK